MQGSLWDQTLPLLCIERAAEEGRNRYFDSGRSGDHFVSCACPHKAVSSLTPNEPHKVRKTRINCRHLTEAAAAAKMVARGMGRTRRMRHDGGRWRRFHGRWSGGGSQFSRRLFR